MSILTDILLIISIAASGYFGSQAGFNRSFFACAAGFLAILAANLYPNQNGINPYLIFAIVLVAVFMAGAFLFRIIHFLYMTIFDKALGAVLGIFVWTIVSVNIVIPSFDYRFRTQGDVEKRTPIYRALDETIRTHFPIFRHNATLTLSKNVTRGVRDIKNVKDKLFPKD